MDLCLLRKTKSQVCARFAWICELQDFSRIRLVIYTFENMSKSLILCATAQELVICGYSKFHSKLFSFFRDWHNNHRLRTYMYISRKDEWFWHVFEGMHHKTNSWKVPPQFANSRKSCANLRFCFAEKTQVHWFHRDIRYVNDVCTYTYQHKA